MGLVALEPVLRTLGNLASLCGSLFCLRQAVFCSRGTRRLLGLLSAGQKGAPWKLKSQTAPRSTSDPRIATSSDWGKGARTRPHAKSGWLARHSSDSMGLASISSHGPVSGLNSSGQWHAETGHMSPLALVCNAKLYSSYAVHVASTW